MGTPAGVGIKRHVCALTPSRNIHRKTTSSTSIPSTCQRLQLVEHAVQVQQSFPDSLH